MKNLFCILEMAINLRAMLTVTGLPANCALRFATFGKTFLSVRV